MKILITTDWYKPNVNGVVTSVINLMSELEKMGHAVHILTLSQGPHSYQEGNVTYVSSLNAEKIYPNARMKIMPARFYVKKIVDWHPDIIHSQCEFNTFSIAKKVARLCQVPLIHTYHTFYEDYTHYFSPSVRVGKYVASAFTKRISAGMNGIIAPTEKAYHVLQKYGIDKPIVVIPSGLNLEQFLQEITKEKRDALRASLGVQADEQVLLYVGRLAKEKNIEELFSFCQSARNEAVKLLIIGDGPYRAELERIAQEMNITHKIIFAGMVLPEEVAQYYQAGDIFVSASQSETQGLTYIEAMASGLPILCKYDSCLDGIVQNEYNGFTYESESQFREYAAKLLADSVLKCAIGQAAQRSICNNYSSERFAKEVVNFYLSFIVNR